MGSSVVGETHNAVLKIVVKGGDWDIVEELLTSRMTNELAIRFTFAFTFSSTRARKAARLILVMKLNETRSRLTIVQMRRFCQRFDLIPITMFDYFWAGD